MKSLTNKLVMSVLALVLTGVALSVGVLAWFTINNQANVQAFDGTVQTGDGLYISANGSDWKNTLTNDDLSIPLTNIEFVALTSQNGRDLTDLDGNGASTGQYIQFDLFFVTSSVFTGVNLANLQMSATATNWIPGVSVEDTRSEGFANAAITEYASNAARVSFTDVANSSPTTLIVEQRAGAGSSTLVNGTAVNGYTGNTLGFGSLTTNEAVLFYNEIMPAADEITSVPTTPTTVQPNNTGAFSNQLVASLHPQNDGTVNHPLLTEFNVGDTVTGVIGTNYKLGKITVRVWIEGWDREAFNAILSGTLTVQFNFEGVRPTP